MQIIGKKLNLNFCTTTEQFYTVSLWNWSFNFYNCVGAWNKRLNNYFYKPFFSDEHSERAVNIGVGIIIAIVVGIVLFVVISVIICIYCVCKKRQASSGTVVRQGAPVQQVTTYNFQQTSQQQPGVVQPPQPQAYPQYPAGQWAVTTSWLRIIRQFFNSFFLTPCPSWSSARVWMFDCRRQIFYIVTKVVCEMTAWVCV